MPGRVVLVNPNRMRPAVAPLGLDYLAQALEAQGWAVDLLDLCLVEAVEAALEDYFAQHSPDAVGITIRNTDDCYWLSQDFLLPHYRDLVSQVKAHTRAPVIVGGVGFSVMPEGVLGFCGADLGIAGEGERALPELLSRLEEGRSYCDIPGLVYRAEGFITRNAPNYLDLDELDITARRAIDNSRYFREGGHRDQAGLQQSLHLLRRPAGQGPPHTAALAAGGGR